IPESRKGCGLKKQLHVVDAQIKVVCLSKRNNEIPKWQRKANLAGLRKKHRFFENSKRDKHRIGSTLNSFKRSARSQAKSCLPAHDMMDQCMGVGNERHQSYRERLIASNLDFLNSRIASSISSTPVAIPSIFKIRFPPIFFIYLPVPDNSRYRSIPIITATGFCRFETT